MGWARDTLGLGAPGVECSLSLGLEGDALQAPLPLRLLGSARHTPGQGQGPYRAPLQPPALQVPARVNVLRRLWPMIGLLQSPTDRATAFAASWRTALDMHQQAAEAAARGAKRWRGGLPARL